MIPFKVQFDKLTEAYIRGEVEPYDACACFVGNLLNKTEKWVRSRGMQYGRIREIDDYTRPLIADALSSVIKESEGTYTLQEVLDLENVFMSTFSANKGDVIPKSRRGVSLDFTNCEEALFLAFEKTLDLLKKIHESKGEKVDDFTFKKREPKLNEAVQVVAR